ncbi:hypothetical protein DUF2953 [Gottschalkia acidurici 9a]|uniref:DUF2953 domain-containing protein n=1 Tax=Gottschalkia acidurici (strain ATCC 7906 / DSM 604 / BCRC 14475 / CIP 104303 / KCTC 5404 / NCIMB 10678 / 9a) TaxID=1128398 RepID=K0B064_GOTA9|nr:DUF2953 domain-containing protein [Gottschalkia acidurici]AFS78422.1 hypothetical protein DUF2953 [Gottschalkia acidurici 9a]
MKLIIFFILFIFIIIFAILLSTYKIKITIKIKDEHSYFSIRASTLQGLLKHQYEVQFIDLILHENKPLLKTITARKEKDSYTKKEEKLNLNEIKNYINIIKKNKEIYEEILNYILEKMIIEKFNLDIKVGLNDAATTAIIYGATNFLVGIPINVITRKKSFTEMNINITPEFNKNILEVNFNCIIILRLVNIIIARRKAKPVNI